MKVLDILKEEEAQGKIVVLGDSIAVGIGPNIKGAVVNATSGIGSAAIATNAMSDKRLQGADLAIVSAGSNDIVKGKGDPDALMANLRAIKTALKAKKIVWIKPYDAGAAFAVSKIANIDGDKTIDLKNYPSSDHVHPSNYFDVASAASYGFKGGKTSVNPDAQPEVDKKIDDKNTDDKKTDTPTKVYPFDKNIQLLQDHLIKLGYNVGNAGADGKFGDDTRAAIRDFQTANKLQVTGTPNGETLALLEKAMKDPEKYKRPMVAGGRPPAPAPGQGGKINPTPGRGSGAGHVTYDDVSGYLKSKNMDDIHRIGILANIQGESSFRPAVMGDHGTSGGLFQHHGPRLAALNRAVPDWRTNWQGQVDFALNEPAGRAYLATKFKDTSEAIAFWLSKFEVTADQVGDLVKRKNFARTMA